MNKDFVTATPDSGSGGATVSVSASENQGGSRSTSLNVGGSGVNKSVSVSQEEAVISYELRISTSSSSLYWGPDDTNVLAPKIQGVFRTTINGNVTSQIVTSSLLNIRIVSQDDAARYNYTIEIAPGPTVRVTPNAIGIYAGSFVVGASYLGYDSTTNVTLNHGT